MKRVMKFVVEKASKEGARLGTLSRLRHDPDRIIETPMCMLYTVVGSAPNLPRDLLLRIESLPAVTQFTLSSLAEHEESITDYKKGIQHFAAMQGFLGYASIQDPGTAFTTGYNDKYSVSVWSKGGRIKIDVELFHKLQEALKVDFYQSLADTDTDRKSSKKRIKKSVDRTLEFLDQCLEKRQKSEVLQDTGILGVIVGGFDENERVRSARETAKHPVDGFCIEGFHNFGAENESFHIPEISGTLKAIFGELPEDKPRVIHGVWGPDQLLEAIAHGIDIFDSSYPHVVTERHSALVFDFSLNTNIKSKADSNISTANSSSESNNSCKSTRPFEVNMKDPVHFDSLQPILEGCSCYTCQNHTRSYVHHLINTSELLAGTLLIIHNFHHYFKFFEAIRSAIKGDKFHDLHKKITSQIHI